MSRSRKITIDPDAVSADTPSVQRRLDRIARNYSELERILARLEEKLEADDRVGNGSPSTPTGRTKRTRRPKPR